MENPQYVMSLEQPGAVAGLHSPHPQFYFELSPSCYSKVRSALKLRIWILPESPQELGRNSPKALGVKCVW